MRNKHLSKVTKLVALGLCTIMVTTGLSGCALLDSKADDISGEIKGNTYNCRFYTNTGENFMNMVGERISMAPNIVKEADYSDGTGWMYIRTASSVMTITIDGAQVESCGSTVIFSEEDLQPDVDFSEESVKDIQSSADGLGDTALVAGVVNKYKNYFGKSRVVVIQSQLGNPICAYSGREVYWEVSPDLPKTTKLMIDGKALYIHRANFQIIDKDLLE